MHCAICWNNLYINVATISVSGLNLSKSQYSKKVPFKDQSAGNQQRFISSLVGTSETTCATNFPKHFCEWLGGIIDGDGSLQVSKKGYTSLEITTGLEDLDLLCFIKNKLGGSIKIRNGVKAYRYRLHDKEGMIRLIKCINGNIRHSSRLAQLHRVCLILNIPVVLPSTLNASSAWFAGFFDADGTINIKFNSSWPQLSISVTNKLLLDIQYYKEVFDGNIYFDNSQNGYYKWSIQSEENINKFINSFAMKFCKSSKSRRFFLVSDYYVLRNLKAYKLESPHHKAWQIFIKKWKGGNLKI